MSSPVIITLDGPAGVGKSTVARAVAETVALPYLDTGAMFRTLALKMGAGAEQCSEDSLRQRCAAWHFTLKGCGGSSVLLCNDVPVGQEVRTEQVGMLASRVAALPVVRACLKQAQRELALSCSLVAEGRDMGTEIFPEAQHKFFLDARPEVRAQRRQKELAAQGSVVPLAELTEQIRQRDTLDRTRAIAPLRPAADAVLVDTSDKDIAAVLAEIVSCIQRKGL